MADTSVSDSYIITIEDLELRLTGDPRLSAIALKAAESTAQTWYLQKATLSIDALSFKGQTYYEYNPNTILDADEQDRAFPRVIDGHTHDWDEDTDGPIVPETVKRACVEESINLYEFYSSKSDQKREKLQRQGVTSFSMSKLSESYKVGSARRLKGLKSEAAYDLLKCYIAGGVEAVSFVNSYRTETPEFCR